MTGGNSSAHPKLIRGLHSAAGTDPSMASDISAELVALIPQMRAFARSLCHDRTEAEDLAQDGLASAWRNRSRFAQGTNLKAWVFTILRNQFYSDRRRSKRLCQLDPEKAAKTLIAVSHPSATVQLDDVRRAMLELPDEQREALTLIAAVGLPYQEAAAICGCPIGTVKSRVSRARRQVMAIVSDGRLARRTRVPGGVMASMIADADGLLSSLVGGPGSVAAAGPHRAKARAQWVRHQEIGR